MSRSKTKSRKRKGISPLKVLLITGGVLLVALVVVLFAAKAMFESWVQGEGFQTWVQKKAARSLKADVQVEEVKWEGRKAFVGRINAHGYPKAEFAKLNLDAIRVSLGGVKNGAFDIPDINVSQAYLEFSDDRKEPGPKITVESVSGVEKAPPGIPEWLRKYIPERVEVGEIVIGSASVQVKNEAGESPLTIRNTRAVIEPNLDTKVMELDASGGKLLLGQRLPPMEIEEASLRFQGNNLFINDASLFVYDDGHVTGLGEVSFADDRARLDLDLKLSGIDVENVAKPDWKNKVKGTIRGPVNISGPVEVPAYRGTLHLEDGVLEAIPILEKIAKYTRTNRFRRLVLDQAQADFTMLGDTLKLRNIQVESDGLTRLEGKIDKSGESITGVLQVGVTSGTLRWIPGAEQKVFTEKRDGFVWTTMNLGGTVAKIEEDLTGRLIAAAGLGIVEKLPENIRDKLNDLLSGNDDPEAGLAEEEEEAKKEVIDTILDSVGDETEATIDTGKKIIDIIGPLFGR